VRAEAGEQVLFHGHPSWRSMVGFHFKGLVAAIVAGVIVGIVSRSRAGHVQAGWVALAVVVVFGLTVAAGALRRAATTYTVTDRRLLVERGLLTRDVQQTTLHCVQSVASRQSVRQRLLRVGTVYFDTAASAGYDFSFHGIADPRGLVRDVEQVMHRSPRTGSWV
jgi:uncharacterized membrane protein YdbT with pleckstrin-like domain